MAPITPLFGTIGLLARTTQNDQDPRRERRLPSLVFEPDPLDEIDAIIGTPRPSRRRSLETMLGIPEPRLDPLETPTPKTPTPKTPTPAAESRTPAPSTPEKTPSDPFDLIRRALEPEPESAPTASRDIELPRSGVPYLAMGDRAPETAYSRLADQLPAYQPGGTLPPQREQFTAGMPHIPFRPDLPFDDRPRMFGREFPTTDFAPTILPAKSVEEAAGITSRFKDGATDLIIAGLKGLATVPEAAIGVADLAMVGGSYHLPVLREIPAGAVGRAAESVGIRPAEWKRHLDSLYSKAQQEAQREVEEADGIVDTAIAALRNPRVIATAIVESLPLMVAGGVVGRALAAAGTAPWLAGALGEGLIAAGSAAEGIRQESGGVLTPRQATLAAASGAGTTFFSAIGGRIAKKLGLPDVDTMLAAAAKDPIAARNVVAVTIGSAITEGFFEELPQSVQEQVLQNYATGKPPWDGVDQAAVLGLLAGSVMGGTVGAAQGLANYGRRAPGAGDQTQVPSLVQGQAAQTSVAARPDVGQPLGPGTPPPAPSPVDQSAAPAPLPREIVATLESRGFTPEDIAKLTPEQADDIIAANISKLDHLGPHAVTPPRSLPIPDYIDPRDPRVSDRPTAAAPTEEPAAPMSAEETRRAMERVQAARDAARTERETAPPTDSPRSYANWVVERLNALNPQLGGRLRTSFEDPTGRTRDVGPAQGSQYGAVLTVGPTGDLATVAHEARHMIDMLLGGHQVTAFVKDIQQQPEAAAALAAYLKDARQNGRIPADVLMTNPAETAAASLAAYFADRQGLEGAAPQLVQFLDAMEAGKYADVAIAPTPASDDPIEPIRKALGVAPPPEDNPEAKDAKKDLYGLIRTKLPTNGTELLAANDEYEKARAGGDPAAVPGNEPAPWQRAMSFDAQWGGWKAKTETVRPTPNWLASQGYINRQKVEDIKANFDTLEGDKPVIVRTAEGQVLILDGHHRLAAAMELDEPVEVRVYEEPAAKAAATSRAEQPTATAEPTEEGTARSGRDVRASGGDETVTSERSVQQARPQPERYTPSKPVSEMTDDEFAEHVLALARQEAQDKATAAATQPEQPTVSPKDLGPEAAAAIEDMAAEVASSPITGGLADVLPDSFQSLADVPLEQSEALRSQQARAQREPADSDAPQSGAERDFQSETDALLSRLSPQAQALISQYVATNDPRVAETIAAEINAVPGLREALTDAIARQFGWRITVYRAGGVGTGAQSWTTSLDRARHFATFDPEGRPAGAGARPIVQGEINAADVLFPAAIEDGEIVVRGGAVQNVHRVTTETNADATAEPQQFIARDGEGRTRVFEHPFEAAVWDALHSHASVKQIDEARRFKGKKWAEFVTKTIGASGAGSGFTWEVTRVGGPMTVTWPDGRKETYTPKSVAAMARALLDKYRPIDPKTGEAVAKPYSVKAMREAFNLTDAQAEAVDALVASMGLNTDHIQVAKGGLPADGALRQEDEETRIRRRMREIDQILYNLEDQALSDMSRYSGWERTWVQHYEWGPVFESPRVRELHKEYDWLKNRLKTLKERAAERAAIARAKGPLQLFQRPSGQPFYSRLQRAVEEAKQSRATGSQWKGIIRNAKIGQSVDEYTFAHVDDLEDTRLYTREEVLAYLKANEIRVEPVVLGDGLEQAPHFNVGGGRVSEDGKFTPYDGDEIGSDLKDFVSALGLDTTSRNDYLAVIDALQRASRDAHHGNGIAIGNVGSSAYWDDSRPAPTFSLVLQPESHGFRNAIVTVGPAEPRFTEYQEPGADAGTYREVFLTVPDVVPDTSELPRLEARLKEVMAELHRPRPDLSAYRAYEEKEQLDRERKQLEERIASLKAGEWLDGHWDYRDIKNPIVRLRFNVRSSGNRRVMFIEEIQPPVPEQPMPEIFRKNWRELGIKWALRYAAENGLDAIAWTTGQMQADRYSLEKHVKAIEWEQSRSEDGLKHVDILTVNAPVQPLLLVNDAGVVVEANEPQFRGRKLEEVVGKELAKRISAEPEGTIEQEGLRIGGEGLKRLYDKDLPAVVNKIPAVKRAGVKVSLSRIGLQPRRLEPTWVPATLDEAARADLKDIGILLDGDVVQLSDLLIEELGYRHRELDEVSPYWALQYGLRKRGILTSDEQIRVRREPKPVETEVPAIEITPELREAVLGGQPLFQGAKGAVEFSVDGKAVIRGLEGADVSTAIHEIAHVARRQLLNRNVPAEQRWGITDKDIRTAEEWAGAKDGVWTVASEEKFALGLEAYLREGKAPSSTLEKVFKAISEWLTAIYQRITGSDIDVGLTDEMRAVFDRLVTRGISGKDRLAVVVSARDARQRTVVVPVEDRVGAFVIHRALNRETTGIDPKGEWVVTHEKSTAMVTNVASKAMARWIAEWLNTFGGEKWGRIVGPTDLNKVFDTAERDEIRNFLRNAHALYQKARKGEKAKGEEVSPTAKVEAEAAPEATPETTADAPAAVEPQPSTPEREARITRILDAVEKDYRHRRGEPVEVKEFEASDGNWYTWVPPGLDRTGRVRTAGWALRDPQGVLHGKREATREALERRIEDGVKRERAEMRAALEQKSDEELKESERYWLRLDHLAADADRRLRKAVRDYKRPARAKVGAADVKTHSARVIAQAVADLIEADALTEERLALALEVYDRAVLKEEVQKLGRALPDDLLTEHQGPRLNISVEYNRRMSAVQVTFAEKPPEEILNQLKAWRFRWGKGHWYRKVTPSQAPGIVAMVKQSLGLETPAAVPQPKPTPRVETWGYPGAMSRGAAANWLGGFFDRGEEVRVRHSAHHEEGWAYRLGDSEGIVWVKYDKSEAMGVSASNLEPAWKNGDVVTQPNRTTRKQDPENFDAAERGVAYEDMTEDELRELLEIGTGDQPQKAAAELQRRSPLKVGDRVEADEGRVTTTAPTGRTAVRAAKPGANPEWTQIGRNALGQTLYEDRNGIRSYIENGSRIIEPVLLRPTRGGMQFEVDRTGDKAKVWEPVAATQKSGEQQKIDDEKAKLKAEAAEIIAQMKAKLRGQINMGLDPDLVRLAAKLIRNYVRQGILEFRAAVQQFRETYGEGAEAADPYIDIAWRELREVRLKAAVAAAIRPNPLTGEAAEIQTQAIEDLQADPVGYITRYRERFGSVLSADSASELFTAYAESPETRAKNGIAVRAAASALIDVLYREMLDEPVPQGKQPVVAFTAGGIDPETNPAHIIFDSTLSAVGPSRANIERALAAGHDVEILYVYGEPIGSRATVLELAKAYADDPRVRVHVFENVSGDTPGLEPRSLEWLEEQQYDERDGTRGIGRRERPADPRDAGSVQGERDGRTAPAPTEVGASDGGRRDLSGGRDADTRLAGGPPRGTGDTGPQGVVGEQSATEEGVQDEPEADRAGRPATGVRNAAKGSRTPRSRTETARGGRVHAPGSVAAAGSSDDVAVAESRGQDPLHFIIQETADLTEGGWTTKLDANMEALRLLKTLQKEGRMATADEQKILARYIGWGHTELAPIVGPDSSTISDPRKLQARQELEQLLTAEELRELHESTANAHYSFHDLPRAMWSFVQKLGFKGGAILEPAVGTGHFFGTMPREIRANKRTRLFGVDKEPIAAAIAKQLYQGAHIQNTPLQDATLPNNYFDLVISNVPFGAIPVFDPKFVSGTRELLTRSVHNYYFGKAVDVARPGGLIVFVTSRYTMDSRSDVVRRYLDEQTDFLGAIRLPDTSFKKTAGTEVVTDVIVLRKKGGPEGQASVPKLAWTASKETKIEWKVRDYPVTSVFHVNEYFISHPKQILGEQRGDGKMQRTSAPQYNVRGEVTQRDIEHAFDQLKLPPNTIVPATVPDRKIATQKPADAKQGTFVLEKGQIYLYDDDGTLVPSGLKGKNLERAKLYIPIRDAYQKVLDVLEARASDEEVGSAQAALRDAYRAFVDAFGYVNKPENVRVIEMDPNGSRVIALEEVERRKVKRGNQTVTEMVLTGLMPIMGEKRDGKWVVSRPIASIQEPTSAESPRDALVYSLAWKGGVDMEYMSALTGLPAESLAQELKGQIFKDPETQTYVTRDEYLSGDVVTKLAQAEAAGEEYAENAVELRKVQPMPLGPDEFSAPFGAAWVPVDLYEKFLNEEGKGRFTLSLTNTEHRTQFYVNGYGRFDYAPPEAYTGAHIAEWIEDALNGRLPTIKVKDNRDSAPRVDPELTEQYRQSLGQLREAWDSWWRANTEASDRLTAIYNSMFNRDAARQFDGSHIVIPNGNPEIELRPWQKNVIWRALQSGNTLIAHAVGAGKTFAMIGIAGEMKRLGLARKPMIVVPNHLVEQWRRDFLRMYPRARVLVPTKQDFEKKNRQRLIAKIANNDWDAVILASTQFLRIAVRPETLKAYIDEQIKQLVLDGADQLGVSSDEFEDLVDGYGEGDKHAKRMIAGREAPRTVKDIARQILNLKARLQKRLDQQKKDAPVVFEQTGIDALLIDEAHLYKNLFFSTSKNNIAGLRGSDSQRAQDMYLKVRLINQASGGRNVVFATGTPVSNAMSELYTMFRYLAQPALERLGMAGFDAWANAYAVARAEMEPTPDGSYKERTRLRDWSNLRELSKLFRRFTDVVLPADLIRSGVLTLPKLKGGRPKSIAIDPHPKLAGFMAQIRARIAALQTGKVDPRDDNHLKISSEASLAAIDMRLVDPTAGDYEGSRIQRAADEIAKRYRESQDVLGTQLVFLDVGTPKAVDPLPDFEDTPAPTEEAAVIEGESEAADADGDDQASDDLVDDQKESEAALAFVRGLGSDRNLYAELKRLLVQEHGIPANEIAFIHQAKDHQDQARLFKAVREGKVRVLIASTDKGGTGMNIQDRLVALHHLDVPWRPADLEQREGRILRQGNQNEEVEIIRYVTRGSYDEYRWGLLATKQGFIYQFMRGDLSTMEDVDPAQFDMQVNQALASGDPRVMDMLNLEREVKGLRARYTNYERKRGRLKQEQEWAEAAIRLNQQKIEKLTPFAEEAAEWAKAPKVTVHARAGRFGTEALSEPVVFDWEDKDSRQAFNEAILKIVEKASSADDGQLVAKAGPFYVLLRAVEKQALVDTENQPLRVRTEVVPVLSVVVAPREIYSNIYRISEGAIIVGNTKEFDPENPPDYRRALGRLFDPDFFEKAIREAKGIIARRTEELEQIKETLAKPFRQLDELKAKEAELAEIRRVVGTGKALAAAARDESLAAADEDSDLPAGAYRDIPEGLSLEMLSSEESKGPDGLTRYRGSDGRMWLAAKGYRYYIPEEDYIASKRQTPSGTATTGAFTEKYTPSTATVQTVTLRPVEFPEMVELAKTLMNTPQVVKRFRGAMDTLGRFQPGMIRIRGDLFKKGQERQLAAVLAHEIGHLVDWLPDRTLKRGNILGRLKTLHNFLKWKYTGRDGVTVHRDDIRAELLALSEKWRPWDKQKASARFRAYRVSSRELYADAISVLLNDPGMLEREAPIFFQEFFAELDRKPEVKDAYFGLQEVLSGTREELIARRRAGVRSMFEHGDAEAIELERLRQAQKVLERKDFKIRFKAQYIDKHAPIIQRVAETEKAAGRRLNPDDNPVYWLEERNYMGGRMKAWMEKHIQPIYQALTEARIDWHTFGEALFYDRIIAGDRSNVANPRGLSPANAEELRRALLEELSNTQQEVLKKAIRHFRAAIREVADDAYEAGLYTDELYEQMVKNPAYATFQVIEHLDKGVTSRVFRQVGTLKDITNPADATILKTLVTMRAIEHQRTKVKVFDFLRQYHPEDIEQAKEIATPKGRRPVEPERGDKRKLITYFEKGRLRGKYVDPYIADSLENVSVGQNNAVISVLRRINSGVLRPLYTTFNLGFQTFNIARDFWRFWKNQPTMTIGRAIKRYWEAIPMAKVRAFGLSEKPSTRELQAYQDLIEAEHAKILSITFNDLTKGREVEETQIEDILVRSGVGGFRQPARHPLVRPFMAVLDAIEKAGNFLETLPKAAGIYEYKGKGSIADIPADERSVIRRKLGSPDFLAGGTHKPYTNEIFLFSNAIVQAWRADLEVATAPDTRSGFWWKTAAVIIVPKLLMFAALYGLWPGDDDDDLQALMRKATEYDLTNYIVVPLGTDSRGNAVYLRVPTDDTSRVIGGMLWKLLRASVGDREVLQTVMQVVDYSAGQFPSPTPALQLVSDVVTFASGGNPYDPFRGRFLFTDDELAARDSRSLRKFLGWEFQQLGGGVIWKFYPGDSAPRQRTLGQTIIEAPMVSNILGRWVRITNYGEVERLRQVQGTVQREEARQRLTEREAIHAAVREYLRLPDGQQTRATQQRMARQIARELYPDDAEERKEREGRIFQTLALSVVRGKADPMADAILGATSNDQKVQMILDMRKTMDRAEFERWLLTAVQNKVISPEVRARVQRESRQ